jgi:hypothetical protein
MSVMNPRSEEQKFTELMDLYKRVVKHLDVKESVFPVARFLEWVNQYARGSRLFHGIEHLLDMTSEDKTLTARGNSYAVVGSFFHDCEYPTIGEDQTEVSKRFLDKYIRVEVVDPNDKSKSKHFVRNDIPEDDVIAKMLLRTFNLKPGAQLNPFAGMNEFYSAVAAAEELSRIGCKPDYILGVVVNIQATVPFGMDKDRFNKIRESAIGLNTELKLGLSKADIDVIMMAAVNTANRDVNGFLGELDPNDTTSKPSINSVLETIAGGDRLRPEEVRSLMLRGVPEPDRHFPLSDYLLARMKGAGLYLQVIPGDETQRTIPNLFHSVTLSDGTIYPPKEWTEKANKLAYENTQPVKVAECARMISVAAIYSISKLTGNDDLLPTKVKLQDLVEGTVDRMTEADLPDGSSRVRVLADSCLSGRHETDYDIRRSPIAQLVLRELDEKQILELAPKVRGCLMAQDKDAAAKAAELMEMFSKAIPKTMLETREQIAKTLTEKEKGALATDIRRVDIPIAVSHA